MMQCDTCKRESDVVLRVVIAKDYNRALSRPIYNCPECYERKERTKAGGASTQQRSPAT